MHAGVIGVGISRLDIGRRAALANGESRGCQSEKGIDVGVQVECPGDASGGGSLELV